MFGACNPSSVFDWSHVVQAFSHAPWTRIASFGSTSQQPQLQPSGFAGFARFAEGNPFSMNQTNYATSQPAVSAIATHSFGQTIDSGSFGSTTTPPAPAFGIPAPPSTTTAAPGSTTSAPAFGIPTTTIGAFGSPITPAFGIPASHSSTTSASGSKTAFGTTITTGLFGSTITPTFSDPMSTRASGSHTIGAFGSTLPPPLCSNCSMPTATSSGFGESFGVSATSVRQLSSTNASLTSTTPASIMPAASIAPTSSSSSFNFPPTPRIGESTFGNPIPPPPPPPPPFSGNQVVIRSEQCRGTRVAPYTKTPEMLASLSSREMAGKLHSISAILFYKSKSHEELRWEDYELGDKGGLFPPYNVFAQHKDSIAPASSSNISNPFTPKASAFGTYAVPGISNPFTPNTSSVFGASIPSSTFSTGLTPSIFGASPLFSSTPSILGASTPSPTFPSRAIFEASAPISPTFPTGSSSSIPGVTPFLYGPIENHNTQTSSPFHWSCTCSLGGQTDNPAIGETSSGSSFNPSYNQPNMSNMNPDGIPPSTPSIPPTKSLPFGHPSQSSFQPSQPTNSGSFNNFHPTQADGGSGFPGASCSCGQNNLRQSYPCVYPLELRVVLPWGLFFYPSPPYPMQVVPYQPQHPGAAYFVLPHSSLEPKFFCQATPPPFGASFGIPCANWSSPSSIVAPGPAFQQSTSPFGIGTHPFPPFSGVAQAGSASQHSKTPLFGTGTHPFAPSSRVAQADSASQHSTTSPFGIGTYPFAPSSGVAQAGSASQYLTTSPFGTGTHPFAPFSGVAQTGSASEHSTSPFGIGTHPFVPSSGVAQAGSASQHSTTSPFGTGTNLFAPFSRVAQAGSVSQHSTSPFGIGTHPFAPSSGVAQAGSASQHSTTSPFGSETHTFAPSSAVAQTGSTTFSFGTGTHPFGPSSGAAHAGSASQHSTISQLGTGTHPSQHSTTSPFTASPGSIRCC